MKITVRQLKQLIREQVEEIWSLGGGDYSTASTEGQLAGWERDRLDRNTERDVEERRYREQQQAAWDREHTPNDADREQAANRARAAASSQAAQAKQAAAGAATARATAAQKEIQDRAKRLYNILNSDRAQEEMIKDPDNFKAYYHLSMKNNPAVYSKGRWNEDVLKALGNMTISTGPLKGQNAREAFETAEEGKLQGPGFFSKVKGFFGMKEVNQLVKEEVARQLRNKR